MDQDLNSLESSILDCNKYAVEALQDQNPTTAIELLRKAKSLIKSFPKSDKCIQLKVITYNNLGCFYRTQKNLKKSLVYLMQAMSYELHLPVNQSSIAGTYLNISKIYEELEDHGKSLNFALKAIRVIEDNFNGKRNTVSSLVVAYQQAGKEYVRIGQRNDGKMFLAQAYELALKYFGMTDKVTMEIENDLNKVKGGQNKNNPVIDKMLCYFEKHMSNGKYSYNSPEPKRGNFPSPPKSHRKIQSLQPIVEYKSPSIQIKNSVSKRKSPLPHPSPSVQSHTTSASIQKMEKFNKNLSIFKSSNSNPSAKLVKLPKNQITRPHFLSKLKKPSSSLVLRSFVCIMRISLIQIQISSTYLNYSTVILIDPPSGKKRKNKSFMEKIIFLQYSIRKYLKNISIIKNM